MHHPVMLLVIWLERSHLPDPILKRKGVADSGERPIKQKIDSALDSLPHKKGVIHRHGAKISVGIKGGHGRLLSVTEQ